MAEVQTSTDSGEMTQRFIEFVMMQAQNAALFLGQIPNPRGGEPEVNLDVAKMFIDQLVMIRSKTKGNLSNDELAVLNNAISNLQMSFYEVSQTQSSTAVSDSAESGGKTDAAIPAPPSDEESSSQGVSPGSGEESEPRKKFSKSYGAS